MRKKGRAGSEGEEWNSEVGCGKKRRERQIGRAAGRGRGENSGGGGSIKKKKRVHAGRGGGGLQGRDLWRSWANGPAVEGAGGCRARRRTAMRRGHPRRGVADSPARATTAG